MKERLLYPDLARGIAILFVVEWHTLNIHLLWTDEWIMPVFFLIMGMFFRKSSDRKSLVVKKSKALLFPALIWSLPMIFIKGIETSFTEVLMLFINPFKSVYGVTWFLWATFWCYLIYNELSIRFKKQYQKLCIVLILSFAGFYMSNIEIGSHRLQLPMYMSTSLSCMLFLYTGEYLKQINLITPPINVIILLITSALSVAGLYQGFKSSSLIDNYYCEQNALVYFITSIGGTVCFISCCALISKLSGLKILCYVGEHSILILLIHPYIKLILKHLIDHGIILFIFCVLFTIPIALLLSKYFPFMEGKIYKNR